MRSYLFDTIYPKAPKMISTENIALNQNTFDEDFTELHYRDLIRLAVKGYRVASYGDIPWGERFLLWRHDIDYSLNRSLALAKCENKEGLKATYFFNPHSNFYNIAESEQHALIKQILNLGHDLGLHFDASFHNVSSEQELNQLVCQEADYLQSLFGVRPLAFSFHNPVAELLKCEEDEYGGLVNCYSNRLKSDVTYCSDSNGYWRFRRLHDVLTESKDHCLQVLTHPGWWQKDQMAPRQRIFRSAYGRAAATMNCYDAGLQKHGRMNHTGELVALQFLKLSNPETYRLCDYLWNTEDFKTLYLTLWNILEGQVNRICRVQLRTVWNIPEVEINTFFEQLHLCSDGIVLFKEIFGQKLWDLAGKMEKDHLKWVNLRGSIIRGYSSTNPEKSKIGCLYMCQLIFKLGEYGKRQVFNYDGLRAEEEVLVQKMDSTRRTRFASNRWEDLKKHINVKGKEGE